MSGRTIQALRLMDEGFNWFLAVIAVELIHLHRTNLLASALEILNLNSGF